jgi:hypothetical protein
MRIFKYKIPQVGFIVDVLMPIGAQILSVQSQNGAIQLWALVDPNVDWEPRSFIAFGTGHEISDELILKYLSTVQEAGGALIWHVFEIEN